MVKVKLKSALERGKSARRYRLNSIPTRVNVTLSLRIKCPRGVLKYICYPKRKSKEGRRVPGCGAARGRQVRESNYFSSSKSIVRD